MNNRIKTIAPTEVGDDIVLLLKSGVTVPLVVTGCSMLPFLRPERDTVNLSAKSEYRRGEILLFRRDDGAFVLHRIRRCYPDGSFLLNGDAQAFCEVVRADQAIASVVSVTRGSVTVREDSLSRKIRNMAWYPTRKIRPYIFSAWMKIRPIFRKT